MEVSVPPHTSGTGHARSSHLGHIGPRLALPSSGNSLSWALAWGWEEGPLAGIAHTLVKMVPSKAPP